MSAAAQVVRVYKESKDFENDAIKARVDTYMIGFTTTRTKSLKPTQS